MGLVYRRRLRAICRRFDNPQQTVMVDPKDLAARGVTVLVLDFDGVLAPHGSETPLPEVGQWLRSCAATFGGSGIFILSNRPDPVRIDYFRRKFPEFHFVSGVRKKPYPDGLERVMEISGAVPGQIMMFDDRLLTGVLGACLAGVEVMYITAPYVSLKDRPLIELFFMLLRYAERKAVALACLLSGERPGAGQTPG